MSLGKPSSLMEPDVLMQPLLTSTPVIVLYSYLRNSEKGLLIKEARMANAGVSIPSGSLLQVGGKKHWGNAVPRHINMTSGEVVASTCACELVALVIEL